MFLLYLISLLFFQDTKILFKDDTANFQIWQLGEFKEKFQTVDTAMGAVELTSYYYEPNLADEDPNFLYLINHNRYLDLEQLPTMDMYEETLAASSESINGQLQYSTEIDINGRKGKLSRIIYEDGQTIVKSKLLIDQNNLYYIQVFATKDNALNGRMDEFLGSFSLLDF